MLVGIWHPKFNSIPSILISFKISNVPKLSKSFKQKLTVTCRKNTSLSDYILKNDIANQQLHSSVSPCRKCKLFPQINRAKLITNDKLKIMEKKKVMETASKPHNVPSSKSCILDIQENNFQSVDIAMT